MMTGPVSPDGGLLFKDRKCRLNQDGRCCSWHAGHVADTAIFNHREGINALCFGIVTHSLPIWIMIGKPWDLWKTSSLLVIYNWDR